KNYQIISILFQLMTSTDYDIIMRHFFPTRRSSDLKSAGKRSSAIGVFRFVGDEHASGRVRDRERHGRVPDRRLRGDSAGPEHGEVACGDDRRISEVRGIEVVDADLAGFAAVDGGTVAAGEAAGDPHCLVELGG